MMKTKSLRIQYHGHPPRFQQRSLVNNPPARKRRIERLALATFVLFIGVMFIQPDLSYGFDYSGQWRGTITESVNHCENLGKAEPGKYTLTITHKGNDIVVMENVVQRPYSGVFNPQQPQIAHVVGTYVDNGGYVAELVDIEFESDTTGGGKSVWRWSSGYYSCGGNFAFTLVKIKP